MQKFTQDPPSNNKRCITDLDLPITPKLSLKPNFHLKEIAEVTEELNTHRNNTESTSLSIPVPEPRNGNKQRCMLCLRKIFGCLFGNQLQFEEHEDDVDKLIVKLRGKKFNFKPRLPPVTRNRKTLVMDLEGVLVYLNRKQFEGSEFEFKMEKRGKEKKVYGMCRFGLQSFLFEMSKQFELVVYSTLGKLEVEKIVSMIDKKKRISHILSQEDCVKFNKTNFLKSLQILGRKSENVIFLESKLVNGVLHPDQLLKIIGFQGERQDRELIQLIPFLREVSKRIIIHPISKRYKEFMNKQIIIKTDTFLKSRSGKREEEFCQKKRKYEENLVSKKRKVHQRTQSQNSLIMKSDEDQTDVATLTNESDESRQSIRVILTPKNF